MKTKKIKFNLNFLNRKKVVNEYKEIITDLQYDEFSNQDKFTSFNKLINTSLLENNISLKDPKYLEFVEKVNKGMDTKYDFVFRNFVVTWINNRRFSKTLLVPAISTNENPNIEAINFNTNSNKEMSSLLETFNDLADELIYAKNEKVEVLPNIVVYQSSETGALKIAFDPQIIK